jgi:hypothetical protein
MSTMLKWTAAVRRETGRTRHNILTAEGTTEQVVGIIRVELLQDASGYFLYRLDRTGVCVADTWHATIEEAKRQASHEFEITAEDWAPVAT